MSNFAIFSLFKYMFVVSYTPGPANLFSLNTSMHYGYKQFLRVYVGLFTAFAIIMALAACITYGFSLFPQMITTFLKYAGVMYILWLSWHIFQGGPIENNEKKNLDRPGFIQGLLLNFSNVKVIFFALSIYQMYMIKYFESLSSLLFWAIPLALFNSSSTFAWALLGRGLFHTYNRYYKVYNAIMAILLVLCAVQILFH